VIKESSLDLWVMKYFKVLPTDPRFVELSDRQKLLLFNAFLEMPLDDYVYELHNSREEMKLSRDDRENLTSLGYNKDQLARMEEQLAIAQAEGGLD